MVKQMIKTLLNGSVINIYGNQYFLRLPFCNSLLNIKSKTATPIKILSTIVSQRRNTCKH